VNIIAAMGSTGHVSFTINRGRTNSATLCLFLSKLFIKSSPFFFFCMKEGCFSF
jgi:hypothetical protein